MRWATTNLANEKHGSYLRPSFRWEQAAVAASCASGLIADRQSYAPAPPLLELHAGGVGIEPQTKALSACGASLFIFQTQNAPAAAAYRDNILRGADDLPFLHNSPGFGKHMNVPLDAYDRKLLRLLQENNKLSQRELADAVNLSASAVNRRIAALEETGVILRNTSIVDPTAVGRPITVIVEVKLESERLDLLDEVKERLVACPQVQQVYYVTGDFDFLLILNVRDMSEYERLTRDLFFVAGNVKNFKTYVAMQRSKMTLCIPTDL